MKTTRQQLRLKNICLGSAEADDQVRQAITSASLEGLKPTQRSIELVRDVATGKKSGDEALMTLRGYYARHA